MGKALFDGNLKRKSFAPGTFYLVQQSENQGQIRNGMVKFSSLEEAKQHFSHV